MRWHKIAERKGHNPLHGVAKYQDKTSGGCTNNFHLWDIGECRLQKKMVVRRRGLQLGSPPPSSCDSPAPGAGPPARRTTFHRHVIPSAAVVCGRRTIHPDGGSSGLEDFDDDGDTTTSEIVDYGGGGGATDHSHSIDRNDRRLFLSSLFASSLPLGFFTTPSPAFAAAKGAAEYDLEYYMRDLL